MVFEGFNFIIDYGLAGVLVLAMVVISTLHYKLEHKLINHINMDKQPEIEARCRVRKGDLKKIFDRIEDIEKKDVRDDGKFDQIDIRLDAIETTMSGIATDVKTILNHFAEKGMDS